ncbi:MAG: glyoxalase-like domain protein [Bacteroidota bacterium]
MIIDHLFIFSTTNGSEADQLVQFGWSEGSSRRHLGQGTINRKFYFDNCFLEILWVVDPDELREAAARDIGLWERSNFKNNGHSRFGMCLVNDGASDALFASCERYQPQYFPPEMPIQYLANTVGPSLPYTFRLPFKGRIPSGEEPIHHQNGIQRLTKATFGLQSLEQNESYLIYFAGESSIQFLPKKYLNLQLEFDFGQQQKSRKFKDLDLVIKY